MNMQVENPVERRQVLEKECRLIHRSNAHFAAWLKDYLASNPSDWLGEGGKHSYWLVPEPLAEDSMKVLASGTDHCFLATSYLPEQESEYFWVLAIAPEPTWWQILLRKIMGVLYILFILLTDFWFHWGRDRCPNCFSTELHPFTFTGDDEAPSHFCNGCNTIWPPRN